MRVGHGGGVVVKKDPCQTEFQFCRVPRMGGIKLQLLCGVRIELAVGSLPYPGNYLDFQFVSPGRDRPLSGFPICKPCLDVRQNPSRDTHFPSYGRRPLPKTKEKKSVNLILERRHIGFGFGSGRLS